MRRDSIAGLYILREEGVYENEEDGTFMWEPMVAGTSRRSGRRRHPLPLPRPLPPHLPPALPLSEDADWSGVGLAVRGIDYFGVGKTDREAFAPPGVTLYEDTDFLADESGLGTKQQRRQHGWDKAMWRRAIALLPPDEEPPLDLFEGLRGARATAWSPRVAVRTRPSLPAPSARRGSWPPSAPSRSSLASRREPLCGRQRGERHGPVHAAPVRC